MAKLKLDLHTHCREATSFAAPTRSVVREIVARIKAAGLDGIAVTEHEDSGYGYRIQHLVEEYFPGQVLIIPGREVEAPFVGHVIELFLSDMLVFRFIAHPGYLTSRWDKHLEGIHGLEIDNGNSDWISEKQKVRETAQRLGLLLLSNSDAHYLDRIGQNYNEIDLKELEAKAEHIV